MRTSALLLIILWLFCSVTAYAQRDRDLKSKGSRNSRTTSRSSRDEACAKLYLGLNMGINNPNGLLGISVDVPVVDHFSLSTGIGRSSWGWKYYGEARGYLKHCHRGFAIGAGVTHNTGLDNFVATMPTTTYGTTDVTLNLQPQTNAFVNLYHFWTIGRRNNRFDLHVGYSFRFDDPQYIVEKPVGAALTDEGNSTVKTIAPGGICIGVGFYFDILAKENR